MEECLFDKAILVLLKKYKIEDIKTSKSFSKIPKEFWEKYENKKIELKINQKFVLDLLQKEGINTGIHCQATGCGKSFIILLYCNQFLKLNMKGNIIIFTERVNILKDFFGIENDSSGYHNKQKWKNMDLIDLDKFEIINRVTNKNKNWVELIKKKSDKTKILLINRAFLTKKEDYENLNKTNIGMIIHDECHNTTSDLCFNMLNYFKILKVPIIGFSATPLRAGKTSGEFNKDRLLKIYGDNDELKILSNFNMMFAIKNDLILPPNFVWYELPKMHTDKNGFTINKIKLEHVSSVFSVLDEVIPKLPYAKIIAWCGTIEFADKWYSIFNKNRSCSDVFGNFDYFIDHSGINSKHNEHNYENFKKKENNSILFCADKHREGSDISNLDCCIFIDFVKNRGAIPFIQSIGRVLRIDTHSKKKQGVVIDSFIPNDKTYDKELVEKIFGYYISFENLSNNEIDKNKYDKFIEMKKSTVFNVDNKNICFEISDDKIIKIDCKNLKWNDIQNKFDPLLQDKIKLSAFDNLKSKSKILKDKFDFNKNTDFIKEYENISEKDKLKYNLPDINQEEYLKLFNIYSWFDLLDIKHNFINLEKLISQLKNKNITQEKWIKLSDKNECIPKYPKYVYKNFTFKMFNHDNLTKEI